MKNKKLTILMAEFMGESVVYSEIFDQFIKQDTPQLGIPYNPFENPAQMNAFIEHPDIRMSVLPVTANSWEAGLRRQEIYSYDKHRTTAINKCAAAFFGEEFEI